MDKKLFIFIYLLTLVLSQTGSLQVIPVTSTLSTNSDYRVTYYTVRTLPASATFLLDFTSTYITVPDSALNASATVQNVAVTGATASCSSNKCLLNLNNEVSIYNNLTITIGSLLNPYFLNAQTINTKVTFNSSYSEDLTWNIDDSHYTPMEITLNSMNQSNYGVGNPVSYTHLTLPTIYSV